MHTLTNLTVPQLKQIGCRLNVKIPHVVARLQQLVAEARQQDPALTQKAAEKLVVSRYL